MFRDNCHFKKYQIYFESCNTHPHNNYVQILSFSGLLGFLIFINAFYFINFFSLKHLKKSFFTKKIYFSDFQLALISCFFNKFMMKSFLTGGFL